MDLEVCREEAPAEVMIRVPRVARSGRDEEVGLEAHATGA
jgi:hypothetical protein